MESRIPKGISMILSILLIIAFAGSIIPKGSAVFFPKSSNVALVPNNFGLNPHGGSLPTNPSGGFPNGDTFNFINLSPTSIRDDAVDPIVAGGFDTVVLVMIDYFDVNWWSDATFRGRIENFVSNGGKLIIYDSENTHNNYSSFIYPFTVSAPGPMGSPNGEIWIVENNTLSHNSTSHPSYVDTSAISWGWDIADANVMVTYNPNWYTDMVCRNYHGTTGPVHTYAEYGDGLIIYNGLDIDYMYDTQVIGNANGREALGMIWYLELAQSFNPPTPPFPHEVPTAGITLSPKNASNLIGTNHIVTARVTNGTAYPIANVTVSFEIIAGPNTGMTGTDITDANGEATFNWMSTSTGIDIVNASAPSPYDASITISATATKEWVTLPPQVIPEVPLGTLSAAIALLLGFGIFAAKGRLRKSVKLRFT